MSQNIHKSNGLRYGWLLFLAFTLWDTIQAAPQAATTNASTTVQNPQAGMLIKRTMDYYGGLKGFSFDLEMAMKGEKPGFTFNTMVHSSVAFRRPNLLAAILQVNADEASIVSDGSYVHVYNPSSKKYSILDAPTNLANLKEEDINKISKAPNPFTYIKPFLGQEGGNILAEARDSAKYIGAESIDETICHRLQFINESFIINLWLENGLRPVVRRITFAPSEAVKASPAFVKKMDGLEMSMMINYRRWEINPDLPKSRFKFKPPPGAERVGSLPESAKQEKADVKKVAEGKPAPNFKLTLLDGNQFELAAHKGRHIVILEFWATWSVPSVRALPIVAKLAEKHKDQDVVFYAINQGGKPETVSPSLAKVKVAPSLVGIEEKPHEISNLYGVLMAPQFVIIDREGIVKFFDSDYYYPRDLEKELEALIAGKTTNTALKAGNSPPLK